jgi:hypothetical protein
MRPLGLPEGSVRAVIALLIVAAVVAAAFVLGDVPAILAGAFGLVIEKYFRERADEKADERARSALMARISPADRGGVVSPAQLVAQAVACLAAALAVAFVTFFGTGCATGIYGVAQTQRDMASNQRAHAAGFRVQAFDPEVGGPSISADLWEIIGNLYGNHPAETIGCNVLDIVGGIALYKTAQHNGWLGLGDDGGSAPDAQRNAYPPAGQQTTINNTADGSVTYQSTVTYQTTTTATDNHSANGDAAMPEVTK